MEQLIQKYVRYFYVALIGGILVQLIDIILTSIKGEICCETFLLIFLSVVNLLLLNNNLRHNKKQQFTECKENSKTLRFTMGIFVIFQALLCFVRNSSWVMLGNHLMTLVVIEIILDYRIKSIEHLEKLANRYAKEKALDQEKGE